MSLTSFIAVLAAVLPLVLANQFVMYTPGGDDTSVQRIDPILAPGSIGRHVHQVFGASGLSDSVTYDSLQSSDCTTVGDASDHGNALDNSLYWHPALFMEAKNGSGYVRVPTNGHKLYYKDAGSDKDTKRDPFEFPHGFRMIAGNPFIRKAPSDVRLQNITQWICHNDGTGGWNQGTGGGFPKGVTDCTAYPGFNGAIHFPHCWNGQDYDASNPSAHISYPDGDIENGACPSSHPTRLPHIFIENQFDLHKVVGQVKPDSFVLAQGDNTGYGWHADFFNGWVDGAIPDLLASCPYNFYGNEDVGICTAFKARATKADACKLAVKYTEEVTYPGPYLPGCNPIIDTDPAPLMPIAALGIATDVCSALGSIASAMPSLPISIPTTMPSLPTTTQESSTTASLTATSVHQTTAADSITSPVGTTVWAAPSAFSVPTTFATFFTTSQSATTSSAPISGSSVSCPTADGTTYTSNGATFQIECGTDHTGGDLSWNWVKSFQECIDTCATTAGCVDVSMRGTACYLKKSIGTSKSDSGVNGAKLISSGTGESASLSTTVTTATTMVTTTAMTTAPSYQHTGGWQDHVQVEWATEYEYVTVTARDQAVHRRHADFHA